MSSTNVTVITWVPAKLSKVMTHLQCIHAESNKHTYKYIYCIAQNIGREKIIKIGKFNQSLQFAMVVQSIPHQNPNYYQYTKVHPVTV